MEGFQLGVIFENSLNNSRLCSLKEFSDITNSVAGS